jgi:hypothetical protein
MAKGIDNDSPVSVSAGRSWSSSPYLPTSQLSRVNIQAESQQCRPGYGQSEATSETSQRECVTPNAVRRQG